MEDRYKEYFLLNNTVQEVKRKNKIVNTAVRGKERVGPCVETSVTRPEKKRTEEEERKEREEEVKGWCGVKEEDIEDLITNLTGLFLPEHAKPLQKQLVRLSKFQIDFPLITQLL